MGGTGPAAARLGLEPGEERLKLGVAGAAGDEPGVVAVRAGEQDEGLRFGRGVQQDAAALEGDDLVGQAVAEELRQVRQRGGGGGGIVFHGQDAVEGQAGVAAFRHVGHGGEAALHDEAGDGAVLRELDGDGLYFRVKPDGSKSWQLRYKKADGKWSWLGLGGYPEACNFS